MASRSMSNAFAKTKAPKPPKVTVPKTVKMKSPIFKTATPKLKMPKPAKDPVVQQFTKPFSGIGTRARLNTAASKTMFNSRYSK
jgi:hypothetical protein